MSDVDAAFVFGTRPEFIKISPVLTACDRRGLSTYVVHTGQHYSSSLDGVIFDELDIPEPDINLGVGSGDHGAQTGAMLAGVERHLREHEPDVVFVQGDTNSTLAGALAATKLGFEVAHVEAGLRSFDRGMPEEVNRVIVDHVADHLFPPTDHSATLLRKEGVSADQVTVTGNTVVDAVRTNRAVATRTSTVLADLDLTAGDFALLTAHRAETVDDEASFAAVLEGVGVAADQLGLDVVYPVHPRAAERLESFDLDVPAAIRLVEPADFFDFLRLEDAAALAFTDSGGVQEETCILGTPCVTLRYGTERPETAFVGANCVAGHEPVDIVAAAIAMRGRTGDWEVPFGDGDAAERILDALAHPDSQLAVGHAR
jgi:UDP-N-acetylglucosamine 2-epimerase (non-hydrolysing)